MSNILPPGQMGLRFSHTVHLKLNKGWSASEPFRRYCEFWLVTDGGAYLQVDGHEYRLKKGDICLLPEILPKANGCDKDKHFHVLVTNFNATLLSDSLFEHIRCADWVVHPTQEVFDKLFAALWACQKEKPFAQPVTIQQEVQGRAAVYTALDVFFSHTQVTERKADSWLGETLQYIAGHCDEKLSIALLANRVALHPKHFARCFREKTGTSPGKYIANVRLERAVQVLYKGLPLQDISEKIGFQSVGQFFRFFKQQTGMTPRAYQKNHIKGEK